MQDQDQLYKDKLAIIVAATLVAILAITIHFRSLGDRSDTTPVAKPYVH